MPLRENEKFYINRKRLGITQEEMADQLGTQTIQISLWERGLSPNPVPACASVDPLKPHERCVLLRKRAELTVNQLAKHIKVSRITVIKMEKGEWNCSRLLDYYKKKGIKL